MVGTAPSAPLPTLRARSWFEPFPHDGGVAKPAVRKQRIIRDDPGLRPTRTDVEAVAVFVRYGVEHEKPASTPPGFLLHLRHQGGANAVAASRAMHQHFLDVG